MSSQSELLAKMFSLYKRRYSGKQLEDKFTEAGLDLVAAGDLSEKEYLRFCSDNDIAPDTHKLKSVVRDREERLRERNSDPCGHGGGGYNRGC